ncbi:replication initiation protein [Vibrio cholerae]|uniref:replication initiation protein n=1 Tax=Vibrio cholerae TaxID=666 RepID=UPI0011D5BEB3|nr:replication initiation protein [Vibrio cholerae]TXY52064.1 replication initiation protein [Vibrio cholerae]GIB31819.1 RepB family plasmid replication initiator protein [Vibrio cholerae]
MTSQVSNDDEKQVVDGTVIPLGPSELDCLDEDSHLKSHTMVFSALDLARRMQDMMAMMLTRMKESDWEGNASPIYTWDIEELSEWFGVDSQHMAAVLKKPSKALSKASAEFEDGNGEFKYNALFKEVSYNKGKLTMIPNERLKKHYLVNVSDKGFAKVDNKIFLALTNPNAKRVFDFMSRFKGEFDMYPISIERAQIYLGVLSTTGEPLKKTYVSEAKFINQLIKPALEHIAQCPETYGKLELIEKNGLLGYELLPMANGKQKIKFNVRWLNAPVDKAKRKEVLAEIDEQMLLFREVTLKGEDGIPQLEQIKKLLKIINEPTEQVDAKIAQVKEERRKSELEKEDRELKALENKVLSDLLKL